MPHITRAQIQAAEQLKAAGWTTAQIAEVLKVDRRTIQRWFSANQEVATTIRRQCDDFAAHCQKLA